MNKAKTTTTAPVTAAEPPCVWENENIDTVFFCNAFSVLHDNAGEYVVIAFGHRSITGAALIHDGDAR